jgi:8-oxo-dGTP pyrophosphatase MutT (NUDIX family)
MVFEAFLNLIPKILTVALPSISAHIKMAPAERVATLQDNSYIDSQPRNSAVMMLFYPKEGKTHFVLIQRNSYPGVHSAQISFPGGKQEPEDIDLAHTALRETYEEIGVMTREIEIIMPFTQLYIPPSNFLVYPFLAIAQKQPQFIPNPAEVEKIIEVPLASLLDDAIIVNTAVNASYRNNITVPAFKIDNHIVWGATAMILSELKETIKSAL